MNLVERWFSELTTKWLRRGTHTSVKDLKDSPGSQLEHDPKPFKPTRYSTTSPHISNEFPRQDTSGPSRN